MKPSCSRFWGAHGGTERILVVCDPHRLELLQCVSGKLQQPNVCAGHQWTGDKIQKLSGQGDLYVCPTYPFSAFPPEVGAGYDIYTMAPCKVTVLVFVE